MTSCAGFRAPNKKETFLSGIPAKTGIPKRSKTGSISHRGRIFAEIR